MHQSPSTAHVSSARTARWTCTASGSLRPRFDQSAGSSSDANRQLWLSCRRNPPSARPMEDCEEQEAPERRRCGQALLGVVHCRVSRRRRRPAVGACARRSHSERLGGPQRHQEETDDRPKSVASSRLTRRPAHICETSRYGAVFERPSYLTRLIRTGWLGREDSNLCISETEFTQTLSPGGQDSHLRISSCKCAGSTL